MHGLVTYDKKNVPLAATEFTSLSKLQEDLTATCNEYARTGFPKYVIAHRRRVGNEAQGCVIVWSLKHLGEPAVNEMVGSRMEVVGGWRFCQARTKKNAERNDCRRVFSGDEARKCSVTIELELTAKKMIKGEALHDR